MNKDMINIDDFVREKLGGREEKEDPAAWLRMKDLLDKEMPERAIPVGFRFGKPLAFLGCALLATVISVGGYKLLHQAPQGAGNTVASGTTGGAAADHNKTSLSPENPTHKNNTGTGTQQATVTTTATSAATGSDQTGTAVPANNNNTVTNTAAHGATATSGHSAPTAHNTQGTTGAGNPGSSQISQNQATTITTARQRIAAAHHVATTGHTTPGNTGVSGKLSTTSINSNSNSEKHNQHRSHTGTQQQSTATTGSTNTGNVNGIASTSNKNHNATPAATVRGSQETAVSTKDATASGNTIQKAGQQNNKNNHRSGTATAKAILQPASGNTGSATTAAITKGTVTGKDNSKVPTGNTTEKIAAGKANTGGGNATESVTAGTNTTGTDHTTRIKDSVNAIKIINRTEISKTPARTPVYSSDTIGIGKVAVPEVPVTAAQPGQGSDNSNSTATAASNTANTATMSRKAKRNSMRLAAANNKKAAQAAANNTQQDPKTLAANTAAPNTTTAPANAAVTAPNSATATTATSTAAKKKKHSDAFAFIRNIHWDEVKDNVKYDIGHAQFYMGVAGGANYSVSNNNSFTGFQFGATGELVFNKHLSLMGELKYFNRSGARKMVDDSYIKESARPDSFTTSGNYFTVFTDSSHRYFNFSTLHSFEMPVTLRYAIRKFYLMTGINVAYYLGVNVEEIGTKYTLPSKSTGAINAAQPILRDTRELDINDFGSRFAMGYVFGAGYQVSPSVQVDLRIVNTFWDNAGSSGAKHLSKDFYKIPSIQLTIGYQFNRADKTRPGFGPNSHP